MRSPKHRRQIDPAIPLITSNNPNFEPRTWLHHARYQSKIQLVRGVDVIHLIEQRPTLRVLNLGYTALTHPAIETIALSIPNSTLFSAALERYVKEVCGPEMSLSEFHDGPVRFLRNTSDARFIDSVYRNRDMQKARRKLMMLDKWWDEDDGTLRNVAAS